MSDYDALFRMLQNTGQEFIQTMSTRPGANPELHICGTTFFFTRHGVLIRAQAETSDEQWARVIAAPKLLQHDCELKIERAPKEEE